MSKIALYDFASRVQPSRCWSFNVWKTRLALNYKNLPYTTIWTEQHCLASTMEALGVSANAEGPRYTLPAIQQLDGTIVVDSAAIAVKLEELYPSPSLHLNSELEGRVTQVIMSVAMPLLAIFMPHAAQVLVTEAAEPTFRATKGAMLGMTLEELEKKRGGEQAWRAAQSGIEDLKMMMVQHKIDKGPFIQGSQVCYADFLILALFEAFKRLGNGMFERITAQHESFTELYVASEQWLQRGD